MRGENNVELWAALAMIREAIELLAPVGAVPRGEDYCPGPMDEAEAIVAGIMALAETKGTP